MFLLTIKFQCLLLVSICTTQEHYDWHYAYANKPSERLDSDCPTDDNELEVTVLVKKKVTTIVQLVTAMIEALVSYYEQLHKMKVEETV